MGSQTFRQFKPGSFQRRLVVKRPVAALAWCIFAFWLAAVSAWYGQGFNLSFPPYVDALAGTTKEEMLSPTGIFLGVFIPLLGLGRLVASAAAGGVFGHAIVCWQGKPRPS